MKPSSLSASTVTRFGTKIKPDANGCLIWTHGKDADGYGVIWNNRKQVRAHRVSWVIAYGAIPRGKMVLHKCPGKHRRDCVEPTHLYLGVARSNSHDMIANNTRLIGVRNKRAKLNDHIVRAIRASDATHVALAKQYGVTPSAIMFVRQRKVWRHV